MSFLALLVITVCSNVTANILLKKGVTSAGGFALEKSNVAAYVLKAALNPFIIIGLCLYGFSFLIWLRVLSTNDLSRVYPIFVTFVFLLTTVGSVLFLKESVNTMRILGMLILIVGIFVVAHS